MNLEQFPINSHYLILFITVPDGLLIGKHSESSKTSIHDEFIIPIHIIHLLN